ncbi:MAG: hypothetical protein ACYTAU_00540 [Planctomycetota bacterium]|jgi:hypothetical protein
MDRVVRFRVLETAARDRFAGGWRMAAAQPNWIVRTAAVVFLLVLVLPIALLVVLAAAAAAVVFGGLALGRGAVERVRRRLRGEGRSNVRVIQRSAGYRVDE